MDLNNIQYTWGEAHLFLSPLASQGGSSSSALWSSNDRHVHTIHEIIPSSSAIWWGQVSRRWSWVCHCRRHRKRVNCIVRRQNQNFILLIESYFDRWRTGWGTKYGGGKGPPTTQCIVWRNLAKYLLVQRGRQWYYGGNNPHTRITNSWGRRFDRGWTWGSGFWS